MIYFRAETAILVLILLEFKPSFRDLKKQHSNILIVFYYIAKFHFGPLLSGFISLEIPIYFVVNSGPNLPQTHSLTLN